MIDFTNIAKFLLSLSYIEHTMRRRMRRWFEILPTPRALRSISLIASGFIFIVRHFFFFSMLLITSFALIWHIYFPIITYAYAAFYIALRL